MNSEVIVSRLRAFLFALTIMMCVGIVAELWLTDHLQAPMQFVPFVLCGLGAIAAFVVWFRPSRATIWALRIVMMISAFGGLLGIYEHVTGNLEFAREVNATKANVAPIATAFTGANPPLAPGALGVTSLVAIAATYAHPELKRV
jgi:hypothetical protein